MLELVHRLISGLDEANVRYVHFKSNEHIDQSVVGETDFDILVDRRSAGDYEAVLQKLDFKRFISPERSAYPGVDDWLGMDWETGKFLHLHTHYQLVTGKSGYKNYVLPWAEIALSSREKDPETGIYFVSPEFELVELYTRIPAKASIVKDAKALRSGYTLKGETLREAKWLWARIDDEKLAKVAAQCGVPQEPGLFRKEHFSPAEYRSYRNWVRNRLQYHQRAGMALVAWRSLFYGYFSGWKGKLKKRVFLPGYHRKKVCHSGGMLIAFLGVDGAGKTTVTSEIASWLSWKMEVTKKSLGVGRREQTKWFRLKRKLKAMLGKKEKPSGGGHSELPRADKPVKKNFKTWRGQRIWLQFARQVRRDLIKIHSYRLGGGIMVVDRYPQLQFWGIADGPKVNPAYPAMREKELEALSIVKDIQPDIVFKLMVPVELSMQRRPEDDPKILQRKFEILNSIEYPNSVVIAVDATQPLEQELLFIKRKIWEQL